MTDQYQGLARGPIDHNASSVINIISEDAITTGSALVLHSPIESAELLPRVEETSVANAQNVYGIAVGGDTDGVYGDGTATTSDLNRATNGAGQGVVVVTQGRCLARVAGEVNNDGASADSGIAIGDQLTASETTAGILVLTGGTTNNDEYVIARALQPVASGETDIIAVDVQRVGVQG